MSMVWTMPTTESYLGKPTFVADRKAKAVLSCQALPWPQQFSLRSDLDRSSAKQTSLL